MKYEIYSGAIKNLVNIFDEKGNFLSKGWAGIVREGHNFLHEPLRSAYPRIDFENHTEHPVDTIWVMKQQRTFYRMLPPVFDVIRFIEFARKL